MDAQPSRTAVLVCQGRAVAHERIGSFRDPVAASLLCEDERAVVEQVRRGEAPKAMRERMTYEFVRGCGAVMAPRTIAIDEAIAERLAAQLVVLGAGLDTRAWRMDGLAGTTVFEVDHPATQVDKRKRLGDRRTTADEVRFVATDFTRGGLDTSLTESGHRMEAPTTWVWEGVVPYLTRDQVTDTVADVARRSAPGSRLIVNYQAPSSRASFGKLIGRVMMRVSGNADPWSAEPHRSHWTPDQMSELLTRHSFTILRDQDLLAISRHLALPTDDLGGSLPTGRVLVADAE